MFFSLVETFHANVMFLRTTRLSSLLIVIHLSLLLFITIKQFAYLSKSSLSNNDRAYRDKTFSSYQHATNDVVTPMQDELLRIQFPRIRSVKHAFCNTIHCREHNIARVLKENVRSLPILGFVQLSLIDP